MYTHVTVMGSAKDLAVPLRSPQLRPAYTPLSPLFPPDLSRKACHAHASTARQQAGVMVIY